MRLLFVQRFLIPVAAAAMIIVVTGCAVQATPTPTALPFVEGNWQFVAAQPGASLPVISGALTGDSTNISGLLHASGAGACVPSNQVIEVAGWINQYGVVNLTGPLVGGTITIQGVIAADGRSIVFSGYWVTGGSCASQPTYSNGQYYKAFTGTYAGTFKDSNGMATSLTATVSQSAQPDAKGLFTLSGGGSFDSNPCLIGPTQVTAAQVTGNSVEMTYTDQSTQDSVKISGQVSTDGKTMTVTNWTTSGRCNSDSGTGQMVQTHS